MVFGKANFTIMLIGIGIIALGFVLMSLETAEYGFGTLGLNVGPMALLVGFILQFVAIMAKPKNKGEQGQA